MHVSMRASCKQRRAARGLIDSFKCRGKLCGWSEVEVLGLAWCVESFASTAYGLIVAGDEDHVTRPPALEMMSATAWETA